MPATEFDERDANQVASQSGIVLALVSPEPKRIIPRDQLECKTVKMRNEIVVIGLMFILSVVASKAMAATAIAGYQLSAAMTDSQYYGGNGGHAFVIAGQDYMFASGDGSLVEYDDGTAMLSGIAYSASSPNRGFSVNVLFQGHTNIAPPGSPKKELMSSAYSENGGPVVTDTWSYYTDFAGTLEGIGELDGTVLTITPRGPALQIGVGANGKNIDFGASAWFGATDAHGNEQIGDFNLNLQAVPIPAALQLMISGLAIMGFAGRRRQVA